MKTPHIIAVTTLSVLAIFVWFCFFIVPEGRQAVILQFGRVIEPAITESGLYFKLPWREARLLEKRILNWDGRPSEIPTREKKYVIVDTTARYRIKDPILFIRELVNVYQAQNRLQTWINNATREVIASHNLVETVRNTNDIIKKQSEISDRNELAEQNKKVEDNALEEEASLDVIADEEISGEIEPITVGREMLTLKIREKARLAMEQYGLELVDVQLKRVALEETVEQEVYKRMITERERIAEKIRSVGRREQAKIRGRISQDLQEIESTAYLQVQQLEGEAEAKAVAIYANAFQQDPEFYEFTRGLELLDKSMNDRSSLVLTPKSEALKLLQEAP